MTPTTARLCVSAAKRLRRVCGAVVERDALAREQQRAVAVFSASAPGAEALGVGGGRLLERAAALRERDEPSTTATREARDAGQYDAEAACARVARGAALVKEGALERRAPGRDGRPVECGGESRAAIEFARVAPAASHSRAATPRWWCRRRPSASSSSQSRSRGHSLSSASWATSASPSADADQPAVSELPEPPPPGVRSSSQRLAARAPPSPVAQPASARGAPRDAALLRREAAVDALGEPRHGAADAAARVGGSAAGAVRCCHSSSSAVDNSGSAPGSPSTSSTSASTAPRRLAGRRAGRQLDPRRSSSRASAGTAVVGAEHAPQLGELARRQRSRRAARSGRARGGERRALAATSASANAARSASSRQAVNSSSNWSTASTAGLAGAAAIARGARTSGGPGAQKRDRRAVAAGEDA